MEKIEIEQPKQDQEMLTKADGRKTPVGLDIQEKIGRGYFGEIYKAEVAVRDEKDIEHVRKKIFAMKEFKGKKSLFAKENKDESGADHAMKIYSALKEAKVDTWTTYRKVEGRDAVVMTYGEQEGDKLVSTSDTSKSKNAVIDHRYERLHNFETALGKAIENAIRAEQNRIEVHGDSWFSVFHDVENSKPNFLSVLLKKEKEHEGEMKKMFIGDFDNITITDKNENYLTERQNLFDLYEYVKAMLSQFTAGSRQYHALAEKMIGNAAKDFEKRAGEKGWWNQTNEYEARRKWKMEQQGIWTDNGNRHFEE